MHPLVNKGAKNDMKVSDENALKGEVCFPSKNEQIRISRYFSELDNLITLHQRKHISTSIYLIMAKKTLIHTAITNEWEQRKLGEVFEEYSEKNHEELPALTIIQGGGTILREESERALQYDKSNLSGYKMVKKDDFIVHLRSFEGGLEKANSDGIISPAYHTFHGDNMDSRFYYPFFRSRRFIDVLLKPHVYGIRDGRSIDIDGMKSILIPVPSYEEQKAIGGFIETLDNLITLHQRKYCVAKMAVIKPKKLHILVYSTNEWEQRKLGEQMYIKSRIGWQALTRDEYLETGDYYLITGTDIDENSHTVDLKRCFYVSKERYEMDDKIQVREGDIIVTKDGTIGKVAMVTGLDKPATLNSHLFVLRDLSGNLDNRYLLQMLNSHIFDAFVNSTKTGSTLTGLSQ